MATALWKKRSETVDDAIHEAGDVLERWEQRLTIDNPDFIERYKKGEIQVLLDVSAGIVPKQYVIVFQGTPKVGDADYPRIKFRRFWKQLRIKARQMHAEICSGNSDRQTVFLDNTQAVQTPENVALASAVWLDSADYVYSVLPHSLYLSHSFGFVFRGTLADREITFPFPDVCSVPETTSQIVESGAKVLDGIARNSRDGQVDWLNVREAIRGSALCINVSDNAVWLTFKELLDGSLKIVDVLVGPFDFDGN